MYKKKDNDNKSQIWAYLGIGVINKSQKHIMNCLSDAKNKLKLHKQLKVYKVLKSLDKITDVCYESHAAMWP
eukprot:UN06135